MTGELTVEQEGTAHSVTAVCNPVHPPLGASDDSQVCVYVVKIIVNLAAITLFP